MKKGFILAEGLLSLFLVGIITSLLVSVWAVNLKFKNRYDYTLEEIRWKKENMLTQINKCVVKEDLSEANTSSP